MTGLTFATAFICIVGVIIAFVGVTALTRGLKYRAKGAVFTGEVVSVTHHSRKNDKGQLIQNYYELYLRVSDGKKTFNAKVKSPNEALKGDRVLLTRRPDGEVIPYKDNGIRWYNGLLELLIGVGIFAWPMAVNRYGDPVASYILAGILVLAGILTLEVYLRDRRKTYDEVQGEYTDILLYDVENQRRIFKVNTWYPLIRYEWEGKTREMLSESNSSVRSAYKVGKKLTLYRDRETGEVREKKASPVLAVLAVAFFALAVVGIVSVL